MLGTSWCELNIIQVNLSALLQTFCHVSMFFFTFLFFYLDLCLDMYRTEVKTCHCIVVQFVIVLLRQKAAHKTHADYSDRKHQLGGTWYSTYLRLVTLKSAQCRYRRAAATLAKIFLHWFSRLHFLIHINRLMNCL